jgi:hypothetical protein
MTDKCIPAARIRAVWLDETISVTEAALRVGLSRSKLWARAMALGLPNRRITLARHVVLADLQQLWADDRFTNAQIAAAFGLSERHMGAVARRFELPPRRLGPKIIYDDALIARMWQAGVALSEIATVFGRCRYTLSHHVRCMGLAPRRAGLRPLMTLAQFYEAELGARMAESARETRDAMALAEMADGIEGRRRVHTLRAAA